jgi:hypothetical protein
MLQNGEPQAKMNLYHYCSANTFLSIAMGQSLWASEFTLSNDLLEGKWIDKTIEHLCDGKNIPKNQRERILSHVNGLRTTLGAVGFCLSEESDLLSQWRGYADDGRGVSVGLRREYLELLVEQQQSQYDGFTTSLGKVEYSLKEQAAEIGFWIDSIFEFLARGAQQVPMGFPHQDDPNWHAIENAQRLWTDFLEEFANLTPDIFRFKNPAFSEERKTRRSLRKGSGD